MALNLVDQTVADQTVVDQTVADQTVVDQTVADQKSLTLGKGSIAAAAVAFFGWNCCSWGWKSWNLCDSTCWDGEKETVHLDSRDTYILCHTPFDDLTYLAEIVFD